MDGVHDMGGMQGFGPVVTADGEATHHHGWEVRAQAIALLTNRSLRDAIERLDPATYLASSYYERWLRAGEARLVERGLVDDDDLDRWRRHFADDPAAEPPTASDPDRVERVRAMRSTVFEPAPDAAYRVGDRVQVARMRPEAHHRCPRYVRGAIGSVERLLGSDVGPGERPGRAAPEPVYTVAFSSIDLFGDRTEAGESPYTVLIDLWERYLEAAR
jgi:nitrile hydratase beta subunit